MANKIELKNDGSVLNIIPEKQFYSGGALSSVEITETKEIYDDEFGSLVFYQHYVGDSTENENAFKLQIRAFQSLRDKLKPKNIIAMISLSDSEVMAIADFAIKMREKQNTVLKSKK